MVRFSNVADNDNNYCRSDNDNVDNRRAYNRRSDLLRMQLTDAQAFLYDVILGSDMIFPSPIPSLVAYKMARSVDYKTTSHEIHGYLSQIDYHRLGDIGYEMAINYGLITWGRDYGC